MIAALDSAAAAALDALRLLIEEASIVGMKGQEAGNVRQRHQGERLSSQVVGLRDLLVLALRDAGVKS